MVFLIIVIVIVQMMRAIISTEKTTIKENKEAENATKVLHLSAYNIR